MGVLDGKSAIVTGSARGIGRATAELLAAQGAQVLINDLDGDVAEQASKEISGETAVFSGDLTKGDAPDQLVAKAIDSFGRIDIIVNNAGYTVDAPIHKMSDEQFQAMLDIHLIVPFKVIRAAAPHLREPAKKEREQGEEVFRKIVNVSSISGTMGNAGQANYSSGKAGVVGLTKTLAKEWGQFKVNVNAVAFGFIETRLTAAKVEDNTMEIGGEKVQLGIPEQLRQIDANPARPPGHARGGRRRRVLPVLAVVELRAWPGAEHHRRPVHGDDLVRGAPIGSRSTRSGSQVPPVPIGAQHTPVHPDRP
jgi:3-oxoacyl-[acyl-carrier protein] reductase